MTGTLPHTDEAPHSPATLFGVTLRGVLPYEATVAFSCATEGVESRADRIRALFAVHAQVEAMGLPEVREYLATRDRIAQHKADADARIAKLKNVIDRSEARRTHELSDLDSDDMGARVLAVDALLSQTRAELSEAAKAREVLDTVADARRPAARKAIEAAARARLAELRHELELRLRDGVLSLEAAAGEALDEVMLSALALEALRVNDPAQTAAGCVSYLL